MAVAKTLGPLLLLVPSHQQGLGSEMQQPKHKSEPMLFFRCHHMKEQDWAVGSRCPHHQKAGSRSILARNWTGENLRGRISWTGLGCRTTMARGAQMQGLHIYSGRKPGNDNPPLTTGKNSVVWCVRSNFQCLPPSQPSQVFSRPLQVANMIKVLHTEFLLSL